MASKKVEVSDFIPLTPENFPIGSTFVSSKNVMFSILEWSITGNFATATLQSPKFNRGEPFSYTINLTHTVNLRKVL
jgi:hypothetical protein